jgi:hypothetical protein
VANQITIDILANTRGLTTGVNDVNSKLNTLNGQVSKVTGAFKGFLGAIGLSIGINWFKDAIKGAIEEEKTFKQLASLYGDDAEAIVSRVNKISSDFKVDDGAIAKYFIDLKGAFSSQFDSFVPTVVEASNVLALLTGKPLDTVIAQWAKTLKDGKITAQEVQKLGIDLTASQEAEFNKLSTTTERLQFLLDIILGKKKEAQGFIDPWQELNYEMGRLKDTIGEELIPVVKTLLDIIFPEQEDGTRKLSEEIKLLVVALGLLYGLEKAFKLTAWIAGIAIAVGGWAAKFATAAKEVGALRAALNLLNPLKKIQIAVTLLLAVPFLPDKIKQIGRDIMDGFEQGIRNWGNPWEKIFKPMFESIWNSLRSWAMIGSPSRKFAQLGQDLMEGLAQGIRNFAFAPVTAAINAASAVWTAIQNRFKSKSPSLLFAGLGGDLMEGLAIGIKDTTDLARLAVVRAGDAVESAFAPQMSFAGVPSRSRGNNVNVTINAGLGTDPYELGRVVSAALDKYSGVNGRR